MIGSRGPRLIGAVVLAGLLPAGAACHWSSPIKPIMAGKAADTLSLPTPVINSHPDPETVRGALDYALVQNEALLASAPKHASLLLTTCRQYVQDAIWFVGPDAEALQFSDAAKAQAIAARASRLASRGKDLCWRALDAEENGTSARLTADPDGAARRFDRDDVPLLYWSAASLGETIALGVAGRPEAAGEWKIVRALAERGLALDDTWSRAALHELMITIESQAGGAEARARQHFTRAVDVQGGLSPGPYIALAIGVARPKRDRAEFEKLLTQAAAIDPEKDPTNRMPATVLRQRARVLLANVDRLLAR